jgi:four helix bundle protein
MPLVKSHRELRVYQSAMDAAVRALELADRFPPEEKYGWRGQTHRSAPSVCTNIAEAFRKRRYKPHFVSKLTDAEAEAAETQVWMELALRRGYIAEEEFADILDRYEKVLAQLVNLRAERQIVGNRGEGVRGYRYYRYHRIIAIIAL